MNKFKKNKKINENELVISFHMDPAQLSKPASKQA